MSTLEQLVPPLELCQQIMDGAFPDSALVWVIGYDGDPSKIESCVMSRRDSEIICTDIAAVTDIIPAPTLEEIMAELPDMTSIQYLNDYPHWELFCPYFDRTPAGGKNAASDMLELWIRWNKKTD